MSENISTKSLALLVNNESVTFLTKTIQQEEVFYSEPYTVKLPNLDKNVTYNEIETSIKSNLALLLYYNNIIVCYQSTPVVIVPSIYFDENNKSATFLSTDKKLDSNTIQLNNIDAHLVYNNYNALNSVLKNLPNFKNAIYTHTGKFLIDESKIDREKIQVFVRLINQKLELCIYKNGIFTLYTIYDIIGDEDVVYYILNTIQQLELDHQQVEVAFEGGISTEHIAMEYLPRYVNKVTYNETYELQGPKYLLYKIFECE